MDPTPTTPSGAILRRPFPNPRPLRRDLQAAHARASWELSEIDVHLEAVLERRQTCLLELDGLRTRLNHRWTEHHVRRHARVDEAPVPPAPPDATALHGTALREVCLTLLRRHGPQELRALHGLLHCYGYVVGGARPVQRLGDAMAYEVRCGRAARLRRGEYQATGDGPRRVRRRERVDVPGEPLPWAPPITDPRPPLVDPPVVHDVEHWSSGSWPAPPDAVEAEVDGLRSGRPPVHAPTSAPPPPPPPVGDDSSTNRPRGGEVDVPAEPGDEPRPPEAQASAPDGPDGPRPASATEGGGRRRQGRRRPARRRRSRPKRRLR